MRTHRRERLWPAIVRAYLGLIAIGALSCCEPTTCRAGVSPDNVMVVVNGNSKVSRTIANHYVHLRHIPSANVIVLHGVPTDTLKIGLGDFKKKILSPVLTQINTRRLAAQARVIVYSADFPTSVDISEHTSKLTDKNLIKYQKPTASINGLTCLYRFVLADDHNYLGWGSNLYARGPFERHFANPFRDEKRKRFENAVEALESGDGAKSAGLFATLFEEHPSLSPLAIKAAEGFIADDNEEAATEMLLEAIEAGWWSATYLRANESLAPLLEQPSIAARLPQLTEAPMVAQEPIGFSSSRGWTSCGHSVPSVSEGVPYLLSCMLAVVHPRGSTADQAIASLRRAANADRSYPEAEFWFTRTKDVRTTTRFPRVGDALLWLGELGYEADLVHAAMPSGQGRCAGLMLGTATMKLADRQWEFVPGALSENLTSFSGAFDTSSQTKMTELIHAGAAMTAGPVAEPYSLPFKFPIPMMYGYYASGATAIESIYLSVTSPYQLLVVGDPLCQPYAKSASDRLSFELESGETRRIRIRRQPVNVDPRHVPTRSGELYIESKLVRRFESETDIGFELPEHASGHLTVAGAVIGEDSTEPRLYWHELLDVEGPHPAPTAIAKKIATEGETSVEVLLSAPGADKIILMHHADVLAAVDLKQARDGSDAAQPVRVSASRVGSGPVTLRAIALFGSHTSLGKPFTVQLESR